MSEDGGLREDEESVDRTQDGESENRETLEEADQFLLNFSQASAEQLEGASLRNEWLSSKHMLGMSSSMQVAQLVIFASKAGLKEMSELQRLSGIVAQADLTTKNAEIQKFKEEAATQLSAERVRVPERLQDPVKRLQLSESETDTPESTPKRKKIKRDKQQGKKPAKLSAGMTVNPFEFWKEMKREEVRKVG